MQAVAGRRASSLGPAARRAAAALAARKPPAALDLPAARREFAALLAGRIGVMSDIASFETELPERGSDEPALVVDVEGFEGPLDLLLTLARQQKVDLARISVLALAEQYLAFIEEARKLRLELAADYLVMAAWLAYLKSRLLLPEPAEPRWAERRGYGQRAAFRLKRLEAIREAAGQLMAPPQLGRDVFHRGDPEPVADIKHPQWTATLYDLLTAYAKQRQQSAFSHMPFKPAQRLGAAGRARNPGAADRAGQRLEQAGQFLMDYLVEPSMRATVMRRALAATLEMVREGAWRCTSNRHSRRSICASARPR